MQPDHGGTSSSPIKTSEFRDLMARLRRDEETRAYQKMVGFKVKSQPLDFSRSLARDPHPTRTTPQTDDDEITYADADRQVALIFNVLVSIVACGVAIWVAARHWNIPQRIAFSMAGSLVVAVAEVGLYMLYLRRLQEAKRERNAQEGVQNCIKHLGQRGEASCIWRSTEKSGERTAN